MRDAECGSPLTLPSLLGVSRQTLWRYSKQGAPPPDRKGMGEEAIQYARGYALEAERKMGEMLATTERAKGAKGNPGGRGAVVVQSPAITAQTPTLAALGITKRESSETKTRISCCRSWR